MEFMHVVALVHILLIYFPVALGGQSTVHRMKSYQRRDGKPWNQESRPKLGRSKPLGTEAAEHAAQMRIIKVCLPCSLMKIRVSVLPKFEANTTK